mmetsp:Transcript_91607/g.165419  ORF Transcript_91607/g.165419 Transcript_91607/m.165419 type:complete len:305 (+) Transcript_91607:69-983(+)
MSYSTLDRYGGITNKYAFQRSGAGAPACGTGGRQWWPDFGPTTKDFSAQDRSHPAETIFEKVIVAGKWNANRKPQVVGGPLEALQLRHPNPAREATLHKEHPAVDVKLAAHEAICRQGALRAAEVRQRRIDQWAGEAPIRMNVTNRSQSETSLDTAGSSQVSRDVYQRHGFLVGRSRGAIADGLNGAGVHHRKHNSLSYQKMLFSGNLTETAVSSSSRKSGNRRYDKQWRTSPEKSFVWDPTSFLPKPRGGWDSQHPAKWPELPATGRREFAAPVAFEKSHSSLFEASGALEARPRAVTEANAG